MNKSVEGRFKSRFQAGPRSVLLTQRKSEFVKYKVSDQFKYFNEKTNLKLPLTFLLKKILYKIKNYKIILYILCYIYISKELFEFKHFI